MVPVRGPVTVIGSVMGSVHVTGTVSVSVNVTVNVSVCVPVGVNVTVNVVPFKSKCWFKYLHFSFVDLTEKASP